VADAPFPLPAHRTRTCGFPASGSRTRNHRAQAWDGWTLWVAAFGSRTLEREVNRLAPLSLSVSSASGLLELRPLPSTGVTRFPRYYEPVRHPKRPGLSLAGVRLGSRSPPLGLPVLQQLPVCRHAVTITPVGSLGQIVRDEGVSAPRVSPATAAFPESLAGRLPR
jgi:hypothetical protein